MSTPHRNKDEADAIQCEIRQIEDTIRQLQERRWALLQKLNSVQAPTAALPPEVLSLIFEFTYHNDDDYRCESTHPHPYPSPHHGFPALTCSHVSSYWRQVAWSTPRLWNSLYTWVSKENADRIPHILELHLQNARALPFDLSLEFGSEEPIHSAVESVLFNSEYSGKIRTLYLTTPPLEWLSSISVSFPRLECLLVGDLDDDTRHHLSLEAASLLRHVQLRDAYMDVTLPWSSVTDISLTYLPIDTCAKLLTQCPNLISFRSALPLNEVVEPDPPTNTTILHHLKTLSWGHSDGSWCLVTLRRIRIPALHTLSWSEAHQPPEEERCFIDALFDHLPDTLLNIELHDITSWTLPLIRHAFSQSPHIRGLSLFGCVRNCMYWVFCALCPGWEGDVTKYLPSLVSLAIRKRPQYHDVPTTVLDVDFSYRILDICRAKLAGPDRQFTLEFRGFKVDWAPGVREELCEMVRDGLQLEISDSDGRVEWSDFNPLVTILGEYPYHVGW